MNFSRRHATRWAATILMAATLFLWACEYEAPVSSEHTIPIDPKVLGLWQYIPDKGRKPIPDEQMMILKYSATEYLIHSPIEKYGIYYRAYPIRIGNLSCVQLEVIGDEDGIPRKDDKLLYHVASYRLVDQELQVAVLNTELVDKTLKTSEAVNSIMLANQRDPALFKTVGRFKRAR